MAKSRKHLHWLFFRPNNTLAGITLAGALCGLKIEPSSGEIEAHMDDATCPECLRWAKIKLGETPTVTQPAKAGSVDVTFEFEAREGTNRKKLLDTLVASFGCPVPMADMLKAVYGDPSDRNRGALNNVLKGALVTIEKKKLPYIIEKDRTSITMKESPNGKNV